MILQLKAQRSVSQGHKVQKHIEGDRVAGVSLHSIECSAFSDLCLHLFIVYVDVM